jgi:uncharacterized repeat protein (TIGR02543 family)
VYLHFLSKMRYNYNNKGVFSMKRNIALLVGMLSILLVTCNNIFHTAASSSRANEPDTGEYTVRFSKNGGDTEAEPNTKTVTAPEIFIDSLPNVEPTRKGYIFTGWNTKPEGNGEEFTANIAVTNSITVYAQWLELPDGSLIVKFDKNNNDIGSQAANPQTKAAIPPKKTIGVLPAEPMRIGWDFTGWNTKADGSGTTFTGDTPVSANITVYAQWKPYECVVTFDKNGGNTEADPLTITVTYPATTTGGTLPGQPERENFIFTGWNTKADGSGTAFTGDTPVGILENKAITIYAQWQEKTYTISGTISKSDGGGASGATVKLFREGNLVTTATTGSDGSYILTGVLSREGYIVEASLTGYSTETTAPFNMPKTDITGKDLTLEKLCSVTFNSNGGNPVTTQYVKSGDPVSPPTDPARTGYTFDNWCTDQPPVTVYDFDTLVTGDITLYAKWNPITYKVRFNSNGGSGSMGDQDFTYDVPQNLTINTFTRTGYTFAGWATSAAGTVVHTDGKSVSNLTNTQGATVILYAKWTGDTYQITYFDTGGGSFSGSHGANYPTTHTYGTATPLVSPTKAGYTFGGWFINSNGAGTALTSLAAEGYTANITLHAKWTIETYSVTYNANGNSVNGMPTPNPVTNVEYGTTISKPSPDPTRAGYTFDGWYSNSGLTLSYDFATPVTSNITLWAKWNAIIYDITYFDTGGGMFSGTHGTNHPTTHTYGTVTPLVSPTKAGYTFGGWFINSNGAGTALTSLSATGYTANITLHAKWDAVTQYTITFNSNEGAGTAPSAQTVNAGSSITLPVQGDLARDGYTFGGWNTNAEGTGIDYAAGASYTPTGNITLYAKWDAVTYTVTFSGNGNAGGTVPSAQTVNAGTNITLPVQGDLARDGYTFGGWNTNAEGTGIDYAAGASYTPTGNITLYAKWNAIQYTVTFNSNEGSSVSSQTVDSGATADEPSPPPTRSGYDFYGWYSDSALTVPYTFNTPVIKNITLYAKWRFSVSGHIYLDGPDTPADGAKVELVIFNLSELKVEHVLAETTTNASGYYDFTGNIIETGKGYMVVASYPGYKQNAMLVGDKYVINLTLLYEGAGARGASQSLNLQQLLLQLIK